MGCIFSRFFSTDEIVYSRELQVNLDIPKNNVYSNKLEFIDIENTENKENNKIIRLITHI
jgi:hypothetical protein